MRIKAPKKLSADHNRLPIRMLTCVVGITAVVYKEVSLTSLPQPFVNPGDAFSQLKPAGRRES